MKLYPETALSIKTNQWYARQPQAYYSTRSWKQAYKFAYESALLGTDTGVAKLYVIDLHRISKDFLDANPS